MSAEQDLFIGITKDHVLDAIKRIDEEGYPPSRQSSMYDIDHGGTAYPPKYVLSLAGHFRDKRFISHKDFSGGETSSAFEFLRKLGFTINPKTASIALKKPKLSQGVSRKYWDTGVMQDEEAPSFFTKEDFTQLNRFVGKSLDRNVPEMMVNYEYTKKTYDKVEYWGSRVRALALPNGEISIVKKSTNQANKFESYLWVKLYPNKELLEWKNLAFTMSISDEEQFCIKIDTIRLREDDPIRKKYLEYRGDFFNSPIVKILKADEVLPSNWDVLIEKSVAIIQQLKNDYEKLLTVTGYSNANNPIAVGRHITHSYPTNLILYGPPGTSKTYRTIDLAVATASPGFEIKGKTRKDIKNEFDKLTRAGRICFVTFHQNFSYEDFVEGIKPQQPEERGGNIIYEVEDGIFKVLCNTARFTSGNFDEVMEKFKNDISATDGKPPLKIVASGTTFDITYRGTSVFYVQPLNTEKDDPWYPVNIENIRKAFESGSFDKIYNPTYVREVINHLKKNYSLVKGNATGENHVLIIDEINRGNVSQIFGELITLIEPSKREGFPDALTVQLPYSKKPFSVPPNVHIIGTMNTADRSVEALDTALRRRFEFREMPARPETIGSEGASKGIIGSVDVVKMLEVINTRIEKLIDKDHQIGHAFFIDAMDEKDLKHAFQNKVLPLLQEYFFGDFGKIGLVLGNSFIEKDNNEQFSFASFKGYDYDGNLKEDLKSRPVFKITDSSKWDFATIHE
jgi:hypothetical protein